jgi:PDZ domain-containing protein
MSRRSLTLAIAGLATVVAIAVAVLLPVPYVILGPGPTLNTLGESSGAPLITISGHQTYPTSGHLNMVTVSYQGGPGVNMNIFQALRAWLDPSEAVVPESELFPAGQSAQQTQAQDTEEMTGSQQLATAAALTALHIEQGAQGRGRHRGGGRQAGGRAELAELDDHRASGGHGADAEGAARR